MFNEKVIYTFGLQNHNLQFCFKINDIDIDKQNIIKQTIPILSYLYTFIFLLLMFNYCTKSVYTKINKYTFI